MRPQVERYQQDAGPLLDAMVTMDTRMLDWPRGVLAAGTQQNHTCRFSNPDFMGLMLGLSTLKLQEGEYGMCLFKKHHRKKSNYGRRTHSVNIYKCLTVKVYS